MLIDFNALIKQGGDLLYRCYLNDLQYALLQLTLVLVLYFT